MIYRLRVILDVEQDVFRDLEIEGFGFARRFTLEHYPSIWFFGQ